MIFYESPHRILKSLEAIEKIFGNVRIVVARELTKKFEEVLRCPVNQAFQHYSQKKILGEFVVLWNLSQETDVEAEGPEENV